MKLFFILITIVLLSCNTRDNAIVQKEEQDFDFVESDSLYHLHCSSCHSPNGNEEIDQFKNIRQLKESDNIKDLEKIKAVHKQMEDIKTIEDRKLNSIVNYILQRDTVIQTH